MSGCHKKFVPRFKPAQNRTSGRSGRAAAASSGLAHSHSTSIRRSVYRTSLCLKPSLLPGNRISRPETKAPKRPLKSSCPFAETDRSQQMPPIRAYLPIVGKSLLVADCVVADAVAVEPVSTPKFPANREINREFCRIRPLGAIFKPDTRVNSEACSEIPYFNGTGNYFEGTGNSGARAGNFISQN